MNPGPGAHAQLQRGVPAPSASSAGLFLALYGVEGRAQSGRRPATVVSGTWLGAPNGKGIGYNTCVLGVAFAKTDVAPPCYTLTCSSPRPRLGSDTQVLGTAARAVAPLFSFIAHRHVHAPNEKTGRRTRGKVASNRCTSAMGCVGCVSRKSKARKEKVW